MIKYIHTNLVSNNWQQLASFYIQVFACKLLLPKQRIDAPWLAQATGLPNAKLTGGHLRLPGYGNKGPILSIYQYEQQMSKATATPNKTGLAHLTFEVEDLEATHKKAIEQGAQALGEITSAQIEGVGVLLLAYLKDPEGNIVQLQQREEVVSVVPDPLKTKSIITETDAPKQATVDQPTTELTKETPNVSKEKVEELVQTEELKEEIVEEQVVPTDKRGFLNALQDDLDAARRSVDINKDIIKSAKDEARKDWQDAKAKFPNLELEEQNKPKTKEELLAALKLEMQLTDEAQEANNLTKDAEKEAPNPPKQDEPTIDFTLPQAPKGLSILLKTAQETSTLALEELPLNFSISELSTFLSRLTQLPYPAQGNEAAADSFIQAICRTYRADSVPLVKYSQTGANKTAQEAAWILVPRLRDSLLHFLGQLEQQPNALEAHPLELLELDASKLGLIYQDLQVITQKAEALGANYLQLQYQ